MQEIKGCSDLIEQNDKDPFIAAVPFCSGTLPAAIRGFFLGKLWIEQKSY